MTGIRRANVEDKILGTSRREIASVVTMTRAGPDGSCKLCEVAIVQLICPTCQTVFAGMTYRSSATVHGVVFDIFLMGCRLAEARVRLRPVGFGETAFTYWLD